MKLGCYSNSYENSFREGNIELLEWMTACSREFMLYGVSIDAAHIQSLDEDYVKKLRRIAVDLNLSISALSIDTDFGIPDAQKRNGELERVEIECAAAAAIGSPILRVQVGSPQESVEHAWKEMVRCMKIACMLGEREGIVIAVENAANSFLHSFEDIERLMFEVESDWLRLNLNPVQLAGDYKDIEKSLLYTVHINAELGEPDDTGYFEGFDYKRFFRTLKEMNYRGFVAVDYRGDNDEPANVKKGVEHLLKAASD